MNADTIPVPWLVLGFAGQVLFSCRFLVQWIASERQKASVVPRVFWWFSLGGGICLLFYAILRQDIVIIVGQAGGLMVYTRNLTLLRKQQKAAPGE